MPAARLLHLSQPSHKALHSTATCRGCRSQASFVCVCDWSVRADITGKLQAFLVTGVGLRFVVLDLQLDDYPPPGGSPCPPACVPAPSLALGLVRIAGHQLGAGVGGQQLLLQLRLLEGAVLSPLRDELGHRRAYPCCRHVQSQLIQVTKFLRSAEEILTEKKSAPASSDKHGKAAATCWEVPSTAP